MNDLAQDADVLLLIADYVAVDSSGKVNALGAGFTMTGRDGNGMIPPQTVAVLINLPQKYAGEQFAVLLELMQEETGQPVLAVGPSGQPEPLRIQQLAAGARPMVAGVAVTEDVPVRVQIVLGFPGGIQVPALGHYRWHMEINGHREQAWTAGFYVLGPPPGPVFGGPTGPSDIPLIPNP